MQINENKKNPVYGIIGAIALVIIGGIAGYVINGSDRINHSTMSKSQCNDISDRIVIAARNNQPDLIAQLNKVYSENCLNREFDEPKPQPKPVGEKKLPETTCAAVEELLKQNLNSENSLDFTDHDSNVIVYQKLAEKGCPENKEKYQNMAQREREIARALNPEYQEKTETKTCAEIEFVLTQKLHCASQYGYCEDADRHIEDAKIYANLSERGCPENKSKYEQLAKRELEIARAINDDNLDDREDSIEIVETYKRLQMQAEAEKMIEKAKKLTNPAIDFIIQLEKIIEE